MRLFPYSQDQIFDGKCAFLRDSGQHTGGLHGSPFGSHGRMDVHLQRGLHIGVSQNFRQGFDIHAALNAARGEGMPLRYNYDKPEKPRRIKGFEVFSLVFSSFSKPKNHTEISRIIGGVSLTTNE